MYVKVITPLDGPITEATTRAPATAIFECTSVRWHKGEGLEVAIDMEGSPCATYHLAPHEVAFILSDNGKTIDRVSIPA